MAIKVADYGYVGEAGDSSIAINAAITAAMSLSTGAEVILPPGILRIENAILLPFLTAKLVRFIGEGPGCTVLNMGPAMSVGLEVGSSTFPGGACGVVCSGFSISGSPSQSGMSLKNANGFIASDVAFNGLSVGMYAESSYWAELERCSFVNLSWCGFRGYTPLHGLRFSRCGFHGIAYQSIRLSNGPSANVSVENCDFEHIGSVLHIDNGVLSLAYERNYVENAEHTLFYILGQAGAVSIRSNEFQTSHATTLGANVSGLEFGYNSLLDVTVNISAADRSVRGNFLRGTSAIVQ